MNTLFDRRLYEREETMVTSLPPSKLVKWNETLKCWTYPNERETSIIQLEDKMKRIKIVEFMKKKLNSVKNLKKKSSESIDFVKAYEEYKSNGGMEVGFTPLKRDGFTLFYPNGKDGYRSFWLRSKTTEIIGNQKSLVGIWVSAGRGVYVGEKAGMTDKQANTTVWFEIDGRFELYQESDMNLLTQTISPSVAGYDCTKGIVYFHSKKTSEIVALNINSFLTSGKKLMKKLNQIEPLKRK